MIFCLLLLALPAFASDNPPVPVPTEERQEIIERLDKSKGDMRSLSARFEQRKEISSLKEAIRTEGTLTVERPDKMRFETLRPERNIVVSDGRRMTVYYPDIKEAQVYELSEDSIRNNSLSFFTSMVWGNFDELQKRFSATLVRDKGDLLFELRPIGKVLSRYVSAVSIRYDEGSGLPVSFEMSTPKGDRTVTRLSGIKVNADIPPGAFDIKLPADVAITNREEDVQHDKSLGY